MALRRNAPLLLAATIAIAVLPLLSGAIPAARSEHDTHQQQLGWITGRSACRGTVEECAGEGEYELDSEVSRRILATSNHIGYGALKPDTVPCSRRGQSYYNCRPGAAANPYSRGCFAITRCRS